jgi:hypothetical protein
LICDSGSKSVDTETYKSHVNFIRQ